MLLSNGPCRVLRDYALLIQIKFVSNDYNWRILVLDLVNTLHPGRDGLEGFLAGQIKAQNDTIGLPVELVSDMPELFLAGCVPNFDLHSLIILFVIVLG